MQHPSTTHSAFHLDSKGWALGPEPDMGPDLKGLWPPKCSPSVQICPHSSGPSPVAPCLSWTLMTWHPCLPSREPSEHRTAASHMFSSTPTFPKCPSSHPSPAPPGGFLLSAHMCSNLPLCSCVTLGKLLNLPEPHFPELYREHLNKTSGKGWCGDYVK